MSGLFIINGHTTPSEGGRQCANGLPSRELNQTRNLFYGGERGAACVREAVVNDEMVTGSYSTQVWMSLERRMGACTL